jgi:two-component system sensor histidine kinase ChvG
MASATVTTKADLLLRGFLRSRTARLIFLWNFVGLVILAVGALVLSETRATLTNAQRTALQVQGAVVANLLIEDAVVEPGLPGAAPFIDPNAAGNLLLNLIPHTTPLTGAPYQGPRIRVADLSGREVADTAALHGDLGETPLWEEPGLNFSNRLAQAAQTFRFTPWPETTTLDAERQAALAGQTASGQRLTETGERVISVTLPLQRVGYIVGAITLESGDVERIMAAERLALLPFILSAAIVILASAFWVAWSLARPLRSLALAADAVRLSGAAKLDVPNLRKRQDEIGDLAQALEAMTGALAERIDANERFAADVSHEIKNPLTSIRSAVETARSAADPVKREQLLGIIANDVGRLDRLITDMTRASRLEAETARGALARVNIAQMLTDLSQSYEALSDGRARVAFLSEANAAEVLGQPGPLAQVFLNLIDNARSFSPAGATVRLRMGVISAKDQKPMIRATVEDEGPGIPESALEKVFQRFYTDRPKGSAFGANSGLGLSIARQIVQAHEGAIWAENIKDRPEGPIRGARFVVELPAAR